MLKKIKKSKKKCEQISIFRFTLKLMLLIGKWLHLERVIFSTIMLKKNRPEDNSSGRFT